MKMFSVTANTRRDKAGGVWGKTCGTAGENLGAAGEAMGAGASWVVRRHGGRRYDDEDDGDDKTNR